MNFGKSLLAFRCRVPYLPYYYPSKYIEDYTPVVSYGKLIKSLLPYFSFPEKEAVRFANCIFHEILANIKRGLAVNVPYLGKFIGSMITSKKVFDVAFNVHVDVPKVIQRCHPILMPHNYAIMTCSAKTAFSAPKFFVTKKKELNSPSSLYTWYKCQLKFMQRNLMLYDNPYPLMGDKPRYKLKESTYTGSISKLDFEKEIKELEKAVIEKTWIQDSKLVKRHVLKDFYGRGKCLCVSYNYLPGKYYRGQDYNSDMQDREIKKNLTRYEVLGSREKKLKIKPLPLKAPKDISWDYFDNEGKGKYLHEEKLRLEDKVGVKAYKRLNPQEAKEKGTTLRLCT